MNGLRPLVSRGWIANRGFNSVLSATRSGRSNKSSLLHARNASTQQSQVDDVHDRLIVVGSGVAGCSAALIAAERHKVPVTLLFAGALPSDCNSYWAQGGIIYRNYDPAANDSAESLVADVQRAGAGLCNDGAVWKLALEGPNRVKELLLDDSENSKFANVPFDRKPDGSLSCCLEASHAAPRIIHYADHTGKAITDHITVAAVNHPLITVVPNTIVTELVTAELKDNYKACLGATVLNKLNGKRETLYSTRGTVLASGGLGAIYEHSTNPPGFNALGSSTALAIRAGAETSDLEYVQFHPTSLYIPNESRFLLTEALRGEGAILRNEAGEAFAKNFHSDGELAPRDIVARGVFHESQKESNGHNVFLDITHRDADWLKKRFPSIDSHLLKRGLDISKDQLPIIPAAHYTCGGVTTDLKGRTNILGLFSAGEAARTGLHGGNRLASTSLLEGLVYGAAVGDFVGIEAEGRDVNEALKDVLYSGNHETIGDINDPTTVDLHSKDTIRNVEGATTLMEKLRRIMWDNVGVVRTPSSLSHAVSELAEIKEEASNLFENSPTLETIGIKDAAYAGEAVAKAAQANKVSAGAHCIILDRPEGAEETKPNVEDSDTDDERQMRPSVMSQ